MKKVYETPRTEIVALHTTGNFLEDIISIPVNPGETEDPSEFTKAKDFNQTWQDPWKEAQW